MSWQEHRERFLSQAQAYFEAVHEDRRAELSLHLDTDRLAGRLERRNDLFEKAFSAYLIFKKSFSETMR